MFALGWRGLMCLYFVFIFQASRHPSLKMDSFGHDGASSTFAPFMTTSSAVANNGMSTISSMDFFTPSAVDPSTKTAVDYDNEFLTFLKSVGITPDSVGLTAAEIESEETNSDGFLTASPPSNSVQGGDGIRPASYHDEVISAKSASSTYPAAWGLGKVPVNHASSETEQEDEPALPR